jgi:hypothetical protein
MKYVMILIVIILTSCTMQPQPAVTHNNIPPADSIGLLTVAALSAGRFTSPRILTFADTIVIGNPNAVIIHEHYSNRPHTGVMMGIITIPYAKIVLKKLGFYSGQVNTADNDEFRRAINSFALAMGYKADGELGPVMARSLLNLDRLIPTQ